MSSRSQSLMTPIGRNLATRRTRPVRSTTSASSTMRSGRSSTRAEYHRNLDPDRNALMVVEGTVNLISRSGSIASLITGLAGRMICSGAGGTSISGGG